MNKTAFILLSLVVSGFAQVPGDARRGAATFQERGCTECHSFQGTGGKIAPDLGQLIRVKNHDPCLP